MSDPRISIIVPTFNRRDSLRITLDGLAAQGFAGAWETVVVSDGSTDGTADMVRDYARTAPFALRFVEQANAGPARARNQGVAEAWGEVIVFLDDDVEPCPAFVSRHAAHHLADPNVAVVAPMLADPARAGVEPVWIAWEHAMLAKQYTAWHTGAWAGVGAHHFYSGNASVRREHVRKRSAAFNETFGRQEDVELAVRLETERGVRFHFDGAAFGIHRPTRTFAGWLNVPFAYGSLDVARAKTDGGRTWERVRHGYHARNRATRLLADICLSRPRWSEPLRKLLLRSAERLHAARQSRPALALLSALYNVHYLEGAASALGGATELRRVLSAPDDPMTQDREVAV